MNYTASVRKLTHWLTAILISLLPVMLAVTENLQSLSGLFSVDRYIRYQSELLFLTISINALSIFDATELLTTLNDQEQIARLLFTTGLCFLIISLITSSILFGGLEQDADGKQPYICYVLPGMVCLAGTIKFLLYQKLNLIQCT